MTTPLCQFYRFARDDEPHPSGEDTVIGCDQEAGDGPLHFFYPTPLGAVRVPVCEQHAEVLRLLVAADDRANRLAAAALEHRAGGGTT